MYDSIWSYPDHVDRSGITGDVALIGFGVEALDGSIGKIDEATFEVGASYVVVDTGPWIFGKRVIIPAGVIQSVDYEAETVTVNRTKDEIKQSPRFDDIVYSDPLRTEIGDYYTRDDLP